jgi:hypothetical protein
MFQYKKYLVKRNDIFLPVHFPLATEELNVLIDGVEHVTAPFRSEIIVSFLKDHRINKEWETANPELVRLITSGLFKSGNLENLFDSCRDNPVFEGQFVAYVTQMIKENRRSVYY